MTAPTLAEAWLDVGPLDAIPLRGARVVQGAPLPLAVFRTSDGGVFAIEDRCAHRGGPLSEGIVHGRHVTCPLHAWVFDLGTGVAAAPDEGCVRTFPVRVDEAGHVHVRVTAG